MGEDKRGTPAPPLTSAEPSLESPRGLEANSAFFHQGEISEPAEAPDLAGAARRRPAALDPDKGESGHAYSGHPL